ncbi:MAG TPA: hypothetical protein VGQ91_10980, partial [Ideonella sp.]|nr:hypothetical protein [Ideonella sp.]
MKDTTMLLPLCETCGTQHGQALTPGLRCAICEDERQYVGWQGQRWTTHEAMRERFTLRMEDDGGVLGIGLAPDFAINQRAFVLPTEAGRILWECLSVVTPQAVEALKAQGGIDL